MVSRHWASLRESAEFPTGVKEVGSLAASAGSQLIIFARIVGSKLTLFASPRLTVCRLLHLSVCNSSQSSDMERSKDHGEDKNTNPAARLIPDSGSAAPNDLYH
jgi:hypothetical protein